MKEILALLLPPTIAFAGGRINECLFGRAALNRHGPGVRFAFGLGTGMLVFSQLVVLGAVSGVQLAPTLAWGGLLWGVAEMIWRLFHHWPALRAWRPDARCAWWLLLLPAAAAMALTGLLATVESTLEYDALAFWVFKAKVMFLKQGADFAAVHQNPLLAYAHWDYPLLVPGLYTLTYGLQGEVYEFTNKVWPFWMVVAMFLAVLSVGRFFARPTLLPVALVTALCFLRAITYWVRMEGATIPLTFYSVMASVSATLWLLDRAQSHLPGLAIVLLAGGAATKFEGMIIALVWAVAVALFLTRGRAWHQPTLWAGIAAAILCQLPYALFRLSGPVPHPLSNWVARALEAPADILANLPAVILLSLGHRFFSLAAFAWGTAPGGGLEWKGRWDGLNTFVDEQTHVLAWVILVLLPFTWWRRPQARSAIGTLSLVVLSVMLFLSFVIACLPELHANGESLNEFTAFMVGRYYHPLLLAWFIGLMLPWLLDAPVTAPAPPAPQAHATG
jgi:hypothetical protein